MAIATDCSSVAPRGASEVRVLHHPVSCSSGGGGWGDDGERESSSTAGAMNAV